MTQAAETSSEQKVTALKCREGTFIGLSSDVYSKRVVAGRKLRTPYHESHKVCEQMLIDAMEKTGANAVLDLQIYPTPVKDPTDGSMWYGLRSYAEADVCLLVEEVECLESERAGVNGHVLLQTKLVNNSLTSLSMLWDRKRNRQLSVVWFFALLSVLVVALLAGRALGW